MPVLPPQILREFLDQSSGLLDRIDQDIAEVDRTGNTALGGGIASAFRSIRSGAAFLELAEIEAAATRAESLLKNFKSDSLEIARRELTTLRNQVSTLRSGVTVELGASSPTDPIPDLSTTIPQPADLDHGAIDAASHIESRTSSNGTHSESHLAASVSRPVSSLLDPTRTIIANVATRTSRELHAEITGGEIEVDESVCQALHGALNVIVSHTSNHTAASCDPSKQPCPSAVIRISAELEGANLCIRIESPVSTLDSWASDPHLDAARNAVESLLGSLTLSADGPSATSIALRVPAHPNRFPAIIVRAADTTCAIPAAQVEEIIPAAGATITSQGTHKTVLIRAQELPLLDAARLFSQSAQDSAGKHMLILRAGGRRIALGVDRALGVQEVAVHPGNAAPAPTAAPSRGWATLGDKSLALVADVPALIRSASPEPVAVAA
jgi:chemotaxis protein histidine kinase CheA